MSASLLAIPFNTADGTSTTLANYHGQVILIVNTASKCGLTPQYQSLQQLYDAQHAEGLEIVAFPANNFLEQEPGSDEEIQQFCQSTYDVSFPVMAKISVAGEDKHPLYAALIAAQPERIGEGPWWDDLVEYGLTPNAPPEVLWNFEKFLLNRAGEVVARFAPDITADDPRIQRAIAEELARPA